MKKFRYKLLVFLWLVGSQFSFGQTVLSLQDAIDSALYNNIGLVIIRNEAKIAENNTSKANAGMLPRLDLSAGTNYANNNLSQKFSTGNEINSNGVENKSYNGLLAVNWTLFDGTKMFATYQKLKILNEMGDMNVQLKTEEIISNVIKAYSEVLKNKIILNGTEKNISLYEERVRLAELKLNIGKSSRVELLQATIDLNTQNGNLIKQKTMLANAELNLAQLIMLPLEKRIEISDSLNINENLNFREVLDNVEVGNKQLQFMRMLEKQRIQEVNEQKANAYPRVNLNAGYNFVSNSSSQGLFLFNQSRGPQLGLSLNWNLYNGVQQKQVENLKIQHQNSQLNYEDTKLQLQSMAINAFYRYQDALSLLKIEKKSQALAIENLNIIMERFKLNESTILELKDAQQINETSLFRLAETYYNAKIAETELLFLIGRLVK